MTAPPTAPGLGPPRPRTALVVNCSAPHYNLGARKLADWLTAEGWAATYHDGDPGLFGGSPDLVALSVVFSWHAPLARDLALRFKPSAEVWCGGPGMTALARWWRDHTGLDATLGVDARFERQAALGEPYRLTFASRGCPVGCWFCVVPKLEGRTFTLYPDFTPAPVLCDNNLSALPGEYQQHIIDRYRASGVRLADCNSGFEPRTFTEDTYRRWSALYRGVWRFAYDETGEAEAVRRMMAVLQDAPARRKQVYVLVGNEPVADCLARAEQVIAWGGEPHVQYVLPLNWLGDPAALRPRHDWTYQLGRDAARYYNRRLWRSLPITEYRPRAGAPRPFASSSGARGSGNAGAPPAPSAVPA